VGEVHSSGSYEEKGVCPRLECKPIYRISKPVVTKVQISTVCSLIALSVVWASDCAVDEVHTCLEDDAVLDSNMLTDISEEPSCYLGS